MPPAATPAGRGPYAKTAGVRQKVVDAAAAGYHGTSMSAVARRAGISNTGLLHHFSTEEALLVAVLEQHDQRAQDYLAAHNALDMLTGMLDIAVREITADIASAAAVVTGEATTPAHPAHPHFATRYDQGRRFYTRVYTALAARGALRTCLPPETLADITASFLDGLRTRRLFGPDDIDVAATVHGFMNGLILAADADPAGRDAKIYDP